MPKIRILDYRLEYEWIGPKPNLDPTIVFLHEGLGSVVKPRWQAGLRLRPVDAFSVDVIYGRNINGENANWLTIAATGRF